MTCNYSAKRKSPAAGVSMYDFENLGGYVNQCKPILIVGTLLTTTGCQSHLTGTALDMTPFGSIFSAVGVLYWILAAGALGWALSRQMSRLNKIITTLLVLAVFGFLPVKNGLQDYADHSNLAELRAEFLAACDRDSGEIAPSSPFRINRLYIHNATENVSGMWGFWIFDDYSRAIDTAGSKSNVTLIRHMSDAVAGAGNYVLKRAVLLQTTKGNFTYRGVRQEIIDTVDGSVKAARTNFYLGNDFARGVSCLDSNWSAGFRSFIKRSIGFTPGNPREDSWVQEVPERFVRAGVLATSAANAADFNAPIYPKGSYSDYNSRTFVIDRVPHYLRQTFNNEPLRMVGVQLFPNRTLLSYESDARAPSALFQIRNRNSGQLLQEIYVKLPLSRLQHQGSIHFYPWRIVQSGVTIESGKIFFDVIQNEAEGEGTTGKYFRYRLEAPWDTEDIGQKNLPAYINDGSHEVFSMPEMDVGNSVTESQVIGQWISEPVGAIWEFKDDYTLESGDGQKWDWTISGVLAAAQRFSSHNNEKASFRISKDGTKLEVTRSNVAGAYRPYLLHRVQPDR